MAEKNSFRTPLPCIICGKAIESAFGEHVDDDSHRIPYDANIFRTHGHYGSTRFDPMSDGVFLEVNICSACMEDRATGGFILQGTASTPRTTFAYERWEYPRLDDHG